jgi:hypothetical protein
VRHRVHRFDVALRAGKPPALAPPVPPARIGPIVCGCAGSVTFHSRTLPSSLPLARVRPSGLNATEFTAPAGR